MATLTFTRVQQPRGLIEYHALRGTEKIATIFKPSGANFWITRLTGETGDISYADGRPLCEGLAANKTWVKTL